MSEQVDKQQLLERFERMRVWQRKDVRAPHKPLLVLSALARIQRGEPRLLPFQELDGQLSTLLRNFGPPRNLVQPGLPFWHLQTDGLWEIPERDALLTALCDRKRRKDVPRSLLHSGNAHGGFVSEVDERLRSDRALVHEIAQRILEAHFPSSIHEDILDAIGFEWETVRLGTRARDPMFRELILRIYERRCAVCGYDGRLGHSDLGLEAAHIRWHTASGPDCAENGLGAVYVPPQAPGSRSYRPG